MNHKIGYIMIPFYSFTIKLGHYLIFVTQFFCSDYSCISLAFGTYIHLGYPGIETMNKKKIFCPLIILKPGPAVHYHQKYMHKRKKKTTKQKCQQQE